MRGMFNTKRLNVQEKSRGVIVFAFNTDLVDYVKIAEQSARLIKHTLNLPVTLVTDKECTSPYFDAVVQTENIMPNSRRGYANLTQWRNGDRYCAYQHSPYDETLLIDSDYLMLDQSLLKLFEITNDYCIMHGNRYLNAIASPYMGPLNLPHVWATAIIFKRTDKSQMLFDLVGKIQRNYQYYRQLYNISATNFRNDYAFAIATNIVNGYTINNTNAMPYTMLTADAKLTSISKRGAMLAIKQNDKAHVVPVQNLHIMDKDYLLSDDFNQFVDTLCQE